MRPPTLVLLQRVVVASLAFVFANVILLACFCRHAEAKEFNASDFNTGGLQTTLTRVRGSDRNGELGAFGFAANRVGFGYEKGIAIRVVNVGSLAVGSKGLQGGINSALAGGYRFSFEKNHGPVVRGGVEIALFGNKWLWDSMIEIPQFHLGYQWLVPYFDLADSRQRPRDAEPPKLIDVAAKGGYILIGRHHTGDAARRDTSGAPEFGGIASIHLGWLGIRASYTKIFPRHGGSDVDQFDASLCGLTSRFFICQTIRYEVGEVRTLDGVLRDSQVSILGLTIGFLKKKGRLDDG
jgi:hypothetical protein